MGKPYSELVAQAERAVASVKSAELKRVAFERVLNDLLGRSGEAPKVGTRLAAPARKPGKETTVRKVRAGPQGYIAELAAEGFFKKPKNIAEVKVELENRGHHIPLTSLSGPMQSLCQKKVLRRHKADGKTFSYSNW